MELDQVLTKLGEFGPYQRRVYHWYCMVTLSVAFHHLAQVFLGGSSDHWCTVPTSNTTDLDCTHYRYSDCGDVEWENDVNDTQCSFYIGQYFGNETGTMKCLDGYTFDHSQYTNTIQEDFGLVCDGKAKIALAQMIYFAGVLTGSIVFGSLADWIGRKPTLIICVVIQCSLGLITAFVNSFAAYCALRFVVAAASIGIFLVAFIIATELVGLKWRTVAGTMIQVYWAVGIMVMALMAYFIRDWTKLQIALSVPTAFALFYMPFMPESVRWLLSQGAIEKAEEVIQKAAKVNNVTLPLHPFSEKVTETDDGTTNHKHTLLDLFRTPVLRMRTVNIMYNWFVIVMVYYGLSLSTSDLGIDPYLAFMVSGLIEIPAYIISIFAIDYIGRRKVLSFSLLLGGVACLLTVFIDPGVLLVTVVMTGKFGLTAAFGIVYVYSAEIFPTPVRSAGMGLASMSGRVGSIVSPLALYMGEWWTPLPRVLFSSMSFTGGIICLLLPETMGRKLPETLQEGEKFSSKPTKSQEMYSMVKSKTETVADPAV